MSKKGGKGQVYTYVVAAGGYVKIGETRNPDGRLSTIQSDCPHDIEVLALVKWDVVSEGDAHRKWAHLRIRGEWFERTPEIEQWAASLVGAGYDERPGPWTYTAGEGELTVTAAEHIPDEGVPYYVTYVNRKGVRIRYDLVNENGEPIRSRDLVTSIADAMAAKMAELRSKERQRRRADPATPEARP